jgi:lipopolysaccharide biosynthesis regulator YciM
MHAYVVTMLFLVLLATKAYGEGLWLSEHFANECEYELALMNWDKAPVAEKQSFDGRLLKARILIQLGRGMEAVNEISTLQAEADEKRMAEILLAMGLAQSAAHLFDQAERTLRAAEAKGADIDLVDAAIAEVRLSKGRAVEAEALLRQVLRRAPDLPGPMMNLATIRAMEGNLVEAAILVRLACQLGYQNPKELRKAPEFEKIRASGFIDDLVTTPTGHCGIY